MSISLTIRSAGLAIASASILSLGCSSPQLSDAVNESVNFPADDFAAACDAWDEWDKPAPPFRIHGGTYHVGTCGISALLITSPDGHLVIDSGTRWGGAIVVANIVALGFSLTDVRYVTHTQEHWDHVGGLAYL